MNPRRFDIFSTPQHFRNG